MANRLKITKATKTFSITGIGASTAAGTNRQAIITVAAGGLKPATKTMTNSDLQVGDKFLVATTQNGLTAGTTYYVGEVLSDTTFVPFRLSPDDMQPAAGTTSPQWPGGGSPVTTASGAIAVATTVAISGSGYPTPSNATGPQMGVVGGDTSLFGSQLTVTSAIAVAAPGRYWFDAASADVFGDKDADFATNATVGEQLSKSFTQDNVPFAVGDLIVGYAYIINNAGTTDFTGIGAENNNHGTVFVATGVGAGTGTVLYSGSGSLNLELGTVGSVDVVATNTASSSAGTGLITCASTADFDLFAPIWFTATIGGLTANTTYFVLTIPSATTFSVSATRNGAGLALSTTTVTTPANIEKLTLGAVSNLTAYDEASIYGANDDADSFILRQKGKRKYLVQNSAGNSGICTLVDGAGATLNANEMSISGTYRASTGNAGGLAGVTSFAQSISDVNGLPFTNAEGTTVTAAYNPGMQATFVAAPAAIAYPAIVSGTRYAVISDGTTTAALLTAVGSTSVAAATGYTIGKSYIITTAGTTDFTLIGADDSVVGTIFTATGVGSGTGFASDAIFTATNAGTGATTGTFQQYSQTGSNKPIIAFA